MKTYIKPELNIEKLNLKEIMLESQTLNRNFDLFEGEDDSAEWWF